ncbi:o-succinylbenzoate synthase [Amorphus sp. MBR-141]
MKIEQIDVYQVAMPMKATWRAAFGVIDHIDSIVVRVKADGVEGWGESAPYAAPNYSGEFTGGAFLVIRDWLGPALLGAEIESGAALQARLAPFKDNRFAKAALDLAWWDAAAQAKDMPLWRLIGGTSPEIRVGEDLSVQETIDAQIDAVRRAHDAGFPRIKLKVRPGWMAEMLGPVRQAAPDAVIHVDCNSGFTLADAEVIRAIDDFGLEMIEQPLAHDDLIDHADLAGQLDTPICLDESIVSVDRARKAIGLNACGFVNLKTGRLGGLTNAIAVHDYCRDNGIPCWVGSMLESAVGQGPSIALATLDNIGYPADIFPSDRFYEVDMGGPDISLSGAGVMVAPDRPGHGFTPDMERLQGCTLRHARVEPTGRSESRA